jgi:hypothetical protein
VQREVVGVFVGATSAQLFSNEVKFSDFQWKTQNSGDKQAIVTPIYGGKNSGGSPANQYR